MKPAFHIPALSGLLALMAALSPAEAAPPGSAAASADKGKGTSFSEKNGLDGFLNQNAFDPARTMSDEATPQTLLSPEALGKFAKREGRFPWRTNIVTTTFWVGEKATKRNPVPNHASSWDTRWAKSFGGYDDPNPARRSNYVPIKFTPRQNPFYIALPYNDIQRSGTKPEAATVVPWFKETFERSGKSVLKGRWLAIRYKGRVAYAQWEDCGPFRTDHWQYVFGNERPKANLNKGAGLDVSPAVRDYLGMKSTDVTDWRFVEFEEVPNGPWATHGDNNTFVQRARAEKSRVAQAGTAKDSSSRTE